MGSALALHYGFSLLGILPDSSTAKNVSEREFFAVDYTLFLNLLFLAMTVGAILPMGWDIFYGGAGFLPL